MFGVEQGDTAAAGRGIDDSCCAGSPTGPTATLGIGWAMLGSSSAQSDWEDWNLGWAHSTGGSHQPKRVRPAGLMGGEPAGDSRDEHGCRGVGVHKHIKKKESKTDGKRTHTIKPSINQSINPTKRTEQNQSIFHLETNTQTKSRCNLNCIINSTR